MNLKKKLERYPKCCEILKKIRKLNFKKESNYKNIKSEIHSIESIKFKINDYKEINFMDLFDDKSVGVEKLRDLLNNKPIQIKMEKKKENIMLSNNWNPYLDNASSYKINNQKWNYYRPIITDEFIEKYVFLGIFTPGMSNGEENSSTFGADNVLDKNTFYEREFLSNSNYIFKNKYNFHYNFTYHHSTKTIDESIQNIQTEIEDMEKKCR